MIERKCNGQCGRWLPESCFTRDSTRTDGLRGKCRECDNKRCSDYRKAKRQRGRPAMVREAESVREARARTLCAALQTYWHIPVNTDAPLRWRLA